MLKQLTQLAQSKLHIKSTTIKSLCNKVIRPGVLITSKHIMTIHVKSSWCKKCRLKFIRDQNETNSS